MIDALNVRDEVQRFGAEVEGDVVVFAPTDWAEFKFRLRESPGIDFVPGTAAEAAVFGLTYQGLLFGLQVHSVRPGQGL